MPVYSFGMLNILCVILLWFTTAQAGGSELPDDQVTPGVVAADGITEQQICSIINGQTYSERHRHTPTSLKQSIRKRDGCDPKNSEVDHRCELSLGCADVKENLWCQPGPSASVTWDYTDKDLMEGYLHEAVCVRHVMTPNQARAYLLAPANWIKGYCSLPGKITLKGKRIFRLDARCVNVK